MTEKDCEYDLSCILDFYEDNPEDRDLAIADGCWVPRNEKDLYYYYIDKDSQELFDTLKGQGIIDIIEESTLADASETFFREMCYDANNKKTCVPGFFRIYNLRIVSDNVECRRTINKVLKAAEVLRILGITRQTLTKYVKENKIQVSRQPNGQYLYNADSVYKLKEAK